MGIVVLSISGLNISRKHAPVDRQAIKQEVQMKQPASEPKSFERLDSVVDLALQRAAEHTEETEAAVAGFRKHQAEAADRVEAALG